MASIPNQPPPSIPKNTPTQKILRTEDIFKAAVRHDWKLVCDLYEINKEVRYQKITCWDDTLLHVAISSAVNPKKKAISSANQRTILKLLTVIEDTNDEEEKRNILDAQNKRGYTPLHLAAARGLDKVCHKISQLCPELVTTARNDLGESPLLTAVRHGKKNTFFVLEAAIYDSSREAVLRDPSVTNDLWLSKRDTRHCTRRDGNHILHYAIKGEQFDLAYEIIHLYPSLVDCVNNSGESALHTLANKPSVFKSGTRLGFYGTILYYNTITKPLKKKFLDFKHKAASLQSQEENDVLPPTYKACLDLFSLIKDFMLHILETAASSLQTGTSTKSCCPDEESQCTNSLQTGASSSSMNYFQELLSGGAENEDQEEGLFPRNYDVAFSLIRIIYHLLIVVTGTESPVLVAAKMGIKEMVKTILHKFPVAIFDQDKEEKNIVLLAVEHRQVRVHNFMVNVPTMKGHVFGKVDKEGNSVLHLAAMLNHSHPWNIPGAALQMQYERKWYKHVLSSMGQEMLIRINNEGRTAQEVFTRSHEKLLKDGNTWLTSTSQSCSVVAALVAAVAFASVGTVPGGFDQLAGFPILAKRPTFQLFAFASLVALCFSVTSLVMFLAILTTSYQARDFDTRVPVKLILGLTSLFTSIASMLVSFCAGDFVLENKLKFVAYPIYIMCFPVILYSVAQFPYIELIKATIKEVPEHNYFQIEDESNC